MSDVLTQILASKQTRLSRGEYAPRGGTERPTDGAAFVASLTAPGTRIIAEFKAKSPSAGEILSNPDGKVESFALSYRRGHAAAISVVTEEDHFGGRPSWLPRMKAMSGLPVLMKDFVIDERQLDFAVSLGADAVLLIARALHGETLGKLRSAARDRGLAVVVEAHGALEIRQAAALEPEVLGVNARDLASFQTDLGSLEAIGEGDPAGSREAGGERHSQPGGHREARARRLSGVPRGRSAPARRRPRGRAAEPARMTAVKVCGLTRAEDVAAACALGAAYLGFNFVGSSPRRVTPAAARQLGEGASRGVLRVGVFGRDEVATVAETAAAAGLDLVQLHVMLTEELVAGSPVPIIAVARPSGDAFNVPRGELLVRCHAVLFDPSEGTGAPLDPGRVAEASWPVPVFVAGGLTPENVGAVIRRLRPAAVDVASGVESAPGVKDRDKLERFFAAVREADGEAS